MHPVFKRLGTEDAAVLAHVAEDVFDHAIDPACAQRFLLEPRNILIVALEGDLVIGQIVAIVHQHLDAPPDLFLENLGVAAHWRRRGVARRLLALAFEAGAALGATAAWVATEQDNEPAIALYKNAGASGAAFLMFSYPSLSTSAAARTP